MRAPENHAALRVLAPHGPLWQRLAAPTVSNPRSRAAWQERRRAVREAVRKRLGLAIAPERLPLDPRPPTTRDIPPGLERVGFQAWPGVYATGCLARPPAGSPRPALLVVGAEPWEVVEAVLLEPLLEAAGHGFVALALDGTILDQQEAGLSTAGLLTWNHLRAFEYLLGRPEVNGARVGLLASGGGMMLGANLIALEERLAAAALLEPIAYYGDVLEIDARALDLTSPPGILDTTDLPELLAVLAPKPLLIPAPANTDDGAAGDLRNVYGLYHLWDRMVEDRPAEMAEHPERRCIAWLAQTLGADDRRENRAADAVPRTQSPAAQVAGWSSVASYYRDRAAQPPRLDSRSARKNYQARVRNDLRSLLREPDGEVALSPSPSADAVAISSEAGGRVSVRHHASTSTLTPALLVIDEPGLDDSFWREACRAAGFALAVTESRLTLDDAPGWTSLVRLAGRPAAGMAARDVIAAIDYLTRRRDVDPRRVALAGLGKAGVVSLIAAAWDERIGFVIADCCGTTYRDGGDGLPGLPGILNVADVPQIASLVAPRPLWLARVPAERSGFSSRRYFDWTRRMYQSFGAEEALKMDTGSMPRVETIVDWLQRQLKRR